VTLVNGMPPPPPIPPVLEVEGSPTRASPLPLIFVVVAIPVSVVIAVYLRELGAEWWSVVGYALTPLFVVLATGWDSISQMAGRKNPWFVIRPGLSRTLRVLVALSLLIGIVHIVRISGWVARTAIQQGWPFLT